MHLHYLLQLNTYLKVQSQYKKVHILIHKNTRRPMPYVRKSMCESVFSFAFKVYIFLKSLLSSAVLLPRRDLKFSPVRQECKPSRKGQQ